MSVLKDWIWAKVLMWLFALLGLGVTGCAASWNLTVRNIAVGTEKHPIVTITAVVDVVSNVDVPLADGVLDFLFAGLFGEQGPPLATKADVDALRKKIDEANDG